jgi:hypothetical protein
MRSEIMTDTGALSVQMLDGRSWERGEIAIVGRPVTLRELFAKCIEWDMHLSLPPLSRITGGPYDGGHVLTAIGDARLYFAVPAGAIPALRPWLSERDYAELLRRTSR